MKTKKYSSLIRTFNSAKTLPNTLSSLEHQTASPTEYIFIDSGSSDNTLDILPHDSKVHKYIGSEFNYAAALNQGIMHVSTEHVLIISSHTILDNSKAVEFALDLLDSNKDIGAAYFSNEDSTELKYQIIDTSNFDGFNGLWNSCSIIRMPLLRRRGFRPEVFFAEDQEWARWLLFTEKKLTARISGAGMQVNNPRYSNKKLLNNYLFIAYYSNRDLLGFRNLARIASKIIMQGPRLALRTRLFNLSLFFRLFACYFVKPKAKSKYF